MAWRPLHSNHAIERVRLLMQFKGPVPTKLSRRMRETLEPKLNDLRMVGPSPIQTINFQFGPGGATPVTQAQATDGWQFSRNASNGFPIEAIVCDGDTLTYETSEYQKWSVYRRRLHKIIGNMIPLIENSLDLQSMTLEYVDRFIYEGPVEQADCTLLLTDITNAINESAVRGFAPWHLHRGWFEQVQGGRALVVQNIDIHEGNSAGHPDVLRSVLLTTRTEYRDPFFISHIEAYDRHLDELHAMTKSHFMEAIRQPLHAAVGIRDVS